MKKILMLALALTTISMAFADKYNPYEVLEERIEKRLEFKYNGSGIEYDIDIYEGSANVKIEGRGSALKKAGLKKLADEVVQLLRTEANVQDVYVVIEEDRVIGEDVILFSEMYR